MHKIFSSLHSYSLFISCTTAGCVGQQNWVIPAGHITKKMTVTSPWSQSQFTQSGGLRVDSMWQQININMEACRAPGEGMSKTCWCLVDFCFLTKPVWALQVCLGMWMSSSGKAVLWRWWRSTVFAVPCCPHSPCLFSTYKKQKLANSPATNLLSRSEPLPAKMSWIYILY